MSVQALLDGILSINVKNITTKRIEGTLEFRSNNNIDNVILPANQTQVIVPYAGMNNDAYIMLTAKSPIDSLWVVAGTNQFTIETATPVASDRQITYFVLSID